MTSYQDITNEETLEIMKAEEQAATIIKAEKDAAKKANKKTQKDTQIKKQSEYKKEVESPVVPQITEEDVNQEQNELIVDDIKKRVLDHVAELGGANPNYLANRFNLTTKEIRDIMK